MNKEQAYDERISPLVIELMKACRQEGIAMLAHFEIDTPAQPGLCASAHQPDAQGMCSAMMAAAIKMLNPAASVSRRQPIH